MALVLLLLGDRQLSAADLLLSELHLGATYDAVWRRRLWRRMPFDVLVVPLAILAATYALAMTDRPAAPPHLPSSTWAPGIEAARTSGSPATTRGAREGRRPPGTAGSSRRPSTCRWRRPSPTSRAPRRRSRGRAVPRTGADRAGARRARGPGARERPRLPGVGVELMRRTGLDDRATGGPVVHPAERWLVLANAVGLRQRLRGRCLERRLHPGAGAPPRGAVPLLHLRDGPAGQRGRRPGLGGELSLLGSFAVWPAVGLASWAACTLSGLDWLSPFLAAGLLSHYWLDGRIWTARARRLAAA